MPTLGPVELGFILVLALILFGAGKLSGVGGALGKSIREFRHAASTDEPKSTPPAHDDPEPRSGS
ncbi:MAG: twin-arginine translocase TatA/TatE family subunit [Chloroflexi bacterium]|nr:twin-arginine translocase TatA/TatE family subunit [Chloroflexota bacterium]